MTTSARGEAVDFDRMTLEVEKLKNQKHGVVSGTEKGTTVKPRTIPRGDLNKPVRGFSPEPMSDPSTSVGDIAPIKVRKATTVKGKTDDPEQAASATLDGILNDLPTELPNENAYTDVEESAKATAKKTRKTIKK